MAVRVKRRRRLIFVLVVAATVVVIGGGGVLYRIRQIRAAAVLARAEGITAFEAGEYFDAMHKLGSYLQHNPDDVEAIYKYAQARLHNPMPRGQHIAEAIGYLRRVVEADPEHVEAESDLLSLYLVAGMRSEAVAVADRMLLVDPGNEPAVRIKFVALMGQRQFDEAMGFADEILRTNPSGEPIHASVVRGHALRAKVFVLTNQAKIDEAFEFSKQYNELIPDDIDGQYKTMQLMRRLGMPAEQYISRAQQLRSDQGEDPRYTLLEAMAYQLAGKWSDAVRLLREVAGTSPTEEWLVQRLVAEMDRVDLYDDATKVLSSAASQLKAVWLQRVLVNRMVQSGMRAEVLEYFEGADIDMKAPDSDSELVGLYAMVLLEAGRHPEAGELIELLGGRIQDAVAEGWVPYLREVKAQDDTDPGEVAEICRKAIAMSPRNPYFHYDLGQAYASLREFDLAINAWAKAAEYGPAWAAPRMRSARALIGTDRRASAIPLAEAAFRRAPRHAEVVMTLAMSVAANIDQIPEDQLDQLMTLVEQIQAVMPDDRRARFIEILILVRSGRQDEARAVMQGILEIEDPPLSEQELMRLAELSRRTGLGLEQLCLVKAQKHYGSTPTQAFNRAVGLLAEGKAEEGLEEFKASEDGDRPGSESAWGISLARYLDAKGDEAALEAWVRVGDQHASDVDVQRAALSSRSAWHDLDFIDRTIERLRSATREEAIAWRISRARWLMAKAEGEDQDLLKAVDMLMDVVNQAPSLLKPRLILARCYKMLENYSGAVEQLAQAAELRPGEHNIKLELAGVLQAQGDYDHVRAVIGEIVGSGRVRVDQVVSCADLLVRQGDIDLAQRLLERIYDPQGKPQEYDLLLAKIYRQKGKVDQTEQVLRKLLAYPTAGAVRFGADFYATQGRDDDAEQVLSQLGQLSLVPGVAAVIRGEHFARSGDVDRAVKEYEAAVESAPSNAAIWKELVRLQIGMGDADETINVATRALEKLGEDPAIQAVVDNAELVRTSLGDEQRVELVRGLLEDDATRTAAIDALQIISSATNEPGATAEVVGRLRQLADGNIQFLALQAYVTRELTRMGRYDDAVIVGTRAMEAFPTHPTPARLSAVALSAAGRWAEVVGVATQWRQRAGEQKRNADLMIAEAKLRIKDPEGALPHILPYTEGHPPESDSYDPFYLLHARVHLMAGRYGEAKAILGPLLDGVTWRQAWIRLAVGMVQDPDEAGAWLERVPSMLDTEKYSEWIVLVRAWSALADKWDRPTFRGQASVLIEDVVSRPSAPAEAWLIQGVVKYAQGELAAAEASYRKALELAPGMHSAKNNLAMALADHGIELAEALRLANEAVAAQPNIPAYYDTLAAVHVALGDYDLAVTQLERSVALEPGNPVWAENLARVLKQAGRDAEANMIGSGGAK